MAPGGAQPAGQCGHVGIGLVEAGHAMRPRVAGGGRRKTAATDRSQQVAAVGQGHRGLAGQRRVDAGRTLALRAMAIGAQILVEPLASSQRAAPRRPDVVCRCTTARAARPVSRAIAADRPPSPADPTQPGAGCCRPPPRPLAPSPWRAATPRSSAVAAVRQPRGRARRPRRRRSARVRTSACRASPPRPASPTPPHPTPPHPSQRNATQRNATQRSATQRNAMQCNAMQCNAMQCNAMQRCAALPPSQPRWPWQAPQWPRPSTRQAPRLTCPDSAGSGWKRTGRKYRLRQTTSASWVL